MLMVIPNEGKKQWLSRMIDGGAVEDLIIGLYQNNYTPVDASTVTDFAPSTFTGYNELLLPPADWNAPVIIGGIAYISTLINPVFTCTAGGPQDAWGWYLREDTSDIIMAAARFNAVRVMAAGASEVLNPFRLGLKTLV